MPSLTPPPTGPTLDWRVFRDWLYKLWKSVTGATFGADTFSYSAAIAGTSSIGGDGQVNYGNYTTPTVPAFIINGPAGTTRALTYQTSGTNRWDITTTSVAEGGANAGSNFAIDAYTDAGALLSTPFSIVRSTGVVSINTALLQPPITFTPTGSVVTTYYNPSSLANWTTATANNCAGLAVDFGGYGVRNFSTSTIPNLSAIEGVTLIPSGATVPGNGVGLSGYVKNNSTATNGVAVYGQATCAATNALVWGANTVSLDNGFATTVWGAEFDMNLTNVNSVAKGVDIVGGSTVEPAVTIGLRIGPLGTFTSPKKRWARGIFIDDGSSITGLEVGAANFSTTSASLPINFYYFNSTNVRTQGLNLIVDSGGNTIFSSNLAAGVFILQTGSQGQIKIGAGNGLGFFNTFPTGQKTGWGTPTGNTSVTNFPGASATLVQCSNVIAQLITDLKLLGFYAA